MTENTSPGGNRADAAAGATANGHRSRADDLLAAMPAEFGKATARLRRDGDAHTGDDDGKTDVNGLRPGDDGYNPYNRPSVNAKHAAAAKVQEASEKRLRRWASRRYPVRALDGRTEPWARALAADIARRNAGRDPVKDTPDMMFSGDKAVNAGATDAHLAALSDLTPDEIGALKIEAAAIREYHRAQVRRKAAAMATPRHPLAEVIRHVSDIANDPPTGTLIDGLIYEQTVTHWVGDGGTYKTFTVLALACSVAAGRDFTHQLKVPQKHPVLYFCAERRHYGMGADVAAWCQRAGLDIASLDLLGWDDVVQLADDEWMAELVEFVKARGIKLIVFDTQRKATKGIEENSSTDIGAALANAQNLAMRANAAVIVIHHTARGQDHARGSSVGRDDTDATVVQKATGPNEAEFRIDKHKSEATGTRYPVKVEKVGGTMPPTEGRAGYGYTTLVATARDPLTMEETADKVAAALTQDDKILVAVVNDADDGPLSPAEVTRRAQARGCQLGKDAVATHLARLAKDNYGRLVTQHVNPTNGRRTYSPKPAADDTGPTDVSAEVVDLTARRRGGKSAQTGAPTPPDTPPPGD
ncbi:AAA family ATPase [Mycolicibacterium arenosum]|uniref:Helicase RepA family protein n=1 Tax=Mycolicibacterium arenosum TaxID=2952157 RepID=A0ABT1LW51_9MYCO|nr:AAA family ATPase [Mycolicibacterium sp. CAU 1645]MCP9271134.1 helicase RepA family protein [Mycolicibacterium sp. CAU 1645]